MTIWIEIKVAGGSLIEHVTQEASELATRLGIAVTFRFNDVSCWAEPDGVSPEVFACRWRAAFDAGGTYPSCTNRVLASDRTMGTQSSSETVSPSPT